MKIKQIHIYGFGKWQDKTFDLTPGLNSFQGQNEEGKSTIYRFIQSMFFGFPKKTKRNRVNTYQPKQGKVYGGRLLLTDTPYGDLVLERQKVGRKEEVHLWDAEGKALDNSLVDELVYHMDLSVYQQFFALSLDQIQGLQDLDEAALSRYFLTVGSGTNEALFAWKEKLQAEADKIYRPSGSKLPLNQALNQLESQAQRVEEIATKEAGYRQVTADLAQAQADLAEAEKNLASALQEERAGQTLLEKYPLYQDYLALNQAQEAGKISLPQDLVTQFDKVAAQKKVLEEQILLQKSQMEDPGLSPDLDWYQKHETYIQELKDLQVQAPSLIQDYQYTSYRAQELAKKMAQGLEAWPLRAEDLPKLPDLDQESRDLLAQADRLEANLKEAQEAQARAQASWEQSKAQYQALQDQVSKDQGQPRRKERDKLAPVLALMAGVTALVLILGLARNQGPILAGVTVLLAGLAFWRFYQSRQGQVSHEGKDQEEAIRLQLLTEQVSERQEGLAAANQQLATAQEALSRQEQVLLAKGQSWQLPEGLKVADLLDKNLETLKASYQDYLILDGQLAEMAQQMVEILDRYQAGPSRIIERAETNRYLSPSQETAESSQATLSRLQSFVKVAADYLQDMAQAQFRFQEAHKRLAKQGKDLDRLQEQLRHIQAQEASWLEASQSQDLVQLATKLLAYKKQEDQKAKLQWLGQQLAPYLDQLHSYDSQEALKADLTRRQEALKASQDQVKALQANRAQLNESKRIMDESGSFEEAQAQLAQIKADVRDLMRQVGAYLLASQMITYLLSDGKSQEVATIFQAALAYFKDLTDGAYDQIQVDQEEIRLRHQSGDWFAVYELSAGTLDQFYIALRLAFIQALASRVSLPLMIDDCFVNFDAKRKARMLDLLAQFGEQGQILYFSYDSLAAGHIIPLRKEGV